MQVYFKYLNTYYFIYFIPYLFINVLYIYIYIYYIYIFYIYMLYIYIYIYLQKILLQVIQIVSYWNKEI